MNIHKQVLATSLAIFSVSLPIKTLAKGLDFSQIFYFGDSLGDNGNTFGFTGEAIPPESFYFEGHFSNGLTWIEYLAQDLKLDPVPSFFDALMPMPETDISNGVNFAFGGALTGTFTTGDDGMTEVENTLPPTFPALQDATLLGLQSQVGIFATQFAPIANPDALYVIWAGANDYLPNEADTNLFRPLTETDTSVNNIFLAINTLVTFGAENLLVLNLPDLGNVPATNNLPNSDDFTDLTNDHNQQLEALVATLPSDVNVIQFDVNSLFEEITTNPGNFGLSNTDNCLVPLFDCFDPNIIIPEDEFTFWDDKHPTTKVHEIIANRVFDTLKPVPESSFPVGILVFGAIGTVTIINRRAKV